MFASLSGLLADWFTLEPSASLLVLVTAVLIFGSVMNDLNTESTGNLRIISRLVISITSGLIFLGILGVLYFLLSRSFTVFKPQAEKLALGEVMAEERNDWGGPFYQSELSVSHSRLYSVLKEFPGPDNKVLYKNVEIRESVDQQSIAGFNGQIQIHVVDQQLQTYMVNAVYEYDIVNQSDYQTTASFKFPIGNSRVIQDLSVKVNRVDIGSQKTVENGSVLWSLDMDPGEHIAVSISYAAQGSGIYVYGVSSSRPIQNFSLTLHIDTFDVFRITQPVMTAINFAETRESTGYGFLWSIEDAIVEPKLGITFKALVAPDLNQKNAIRLLRYMPRGLMLFGVMLAFTLMILRIKLDLRKFFLCLAVYSANVLMFMGLDLLKINNVFIMPLIGLLTLAVIFLIYAALERKALLLILGISVLFVLGYPYGGLLEGAAARASFDGFSQVFVIIYIFVLSLYVRVSKRDMPVR